MSEVSGLIIGKYRLFGKIGTGGMGTVHLGRFFGPGGFRRIVAIKRLHPQFAEDEDFVGAFLDEARLASRIHHPNVVASLDVVAEGGEVFLVFEHVPGVALSTLLVHARKRGEAVPTGVVVAVMVQVLRGLQAAHDAKGDRGEPLGLIHRDVSPHNVLVGRDGAARLLDFGVAKAAGHSQHTEEGVVKGKRAYMAPEHLVGAAAQVSDVYSAAVVLWEMITGQRLFPDDTSIAARLSRESVRAPSSVDGPARSAGEAEALDAVVLRGLAPDVVTRFASADEMALALEGIGAASARDVGIWVEGLAQDELAARDRLVEQAEQATNALPPPVTTTTTAAASVAVIPAAGPSSSTSPAPARSRLWAAAIAIVAAIALAIVFWSRAPAPDVASTTPPDRAPAGHATSVETREPPTSNDAASASVPVSVSASVSAPASVPAPPKPRPGPTKRPPPPACKPYVTDANGHKKFNEACLR